MSDLASLIARLEAAEGASRELDALIVEALWPVTVDRTIPEDPRVYRTEHMVIGGEPVEMDVCEQIPDYTASIDSALLLVPEGMGWQVSDRAPKPHAGRAYIHNREPINIGGGLTRNPRYRGYECTAATPPIALCIAALKARAQG